MILGPPPHVSQTARPPALGHTGGQSSSTDPGQAGRKQQGAIRPEGEETVWEKDNTAEKQQAGAQPPQTSVHF